jgi:hypothetical protein
MPLTELLFLVFSYLFSYVVTYSNSLGLTTYSRMSIGGLAVCVGVGLLFFHPSLCGQLLPYGCAFNVIFLVANYETLLKISAYYQGRRFYLHAKDSQDMTGLGLPEHNSHFTVLDKFISVFLILSLVTGPIVWIVLLKQLFCA